MVVYCDQKSSEEGVWFLQRVPFGCFVIGVLAVIGLDLGELESGAGVVVDGLPSGVGIQDPRPPFAGAVAAPTDSTKGDMDFGSHGRVVDAGHACPDFTGELIDPLPILGVNGAA
jgi:hypothetical protein